MLSLDVLLGFARGLARCRSQPPLSPKSQEGVSAPKLLRLRRAHGCHLPSKVVPRPSRPERRGRGLSSPVLVGTESWDTDLAAIQVIQGWGVGVVHAGPRLEAD